MVWEGKRRRMFLGFGHWEVPRKGSLLQEGVKESKVKGRARSPVIQERDWGFDLL